MSIKSVIIQYFCRFIPDYVWLQLKYIKFFGRKFDSKNPKTFNEKLQWLKLHDRKDIYSTMVDKLAVKEYAANILGNEHIIPILGVYDKFDDICFDELPNQFVIKCTHDCGGIAICKDKKNFDIASAREKINKHLKLNYYWLYREWPYKNVKPKIIVEKYMEDDSTHELRDYKFFCFNGHVECFKIDFNRSINHQANYYDRDGKLLKFGEIICPPDYDKELVLPVNLKKMISFAEKIAKDNKFLRVDFYEVNKKVYFGEITFYPASGFGRFTNENWDYKLGNLIKL